MIKTEYVDTEQGKYYSSSKNSRGVAVLVHKNASLSMLQTVADSDETFLTNKSDFQSRPASYAKKKTPWLDV